MKDDTPVARPKKKEWMFKVQNPVYKKAKFLRCEKDLKKKKENKNKRRGIQKCWT